MLWCFFCTKKFALTLPPRMRSPLVTTRMRIHEMFRVRGFNRPKIKRSMGFSRRWPLTFQGTNISHQNGKGKSSTQKCRLLVGDMLGISGGYPYYSQKNPWRYGNCKFAKLIVRGSICLGVPSNHPGFQRGGISRVFFSQKTDLQIQHDTKTPQKFHGLERVFELVVATQTCFMFHPDYLEKMDSHFDVCIFFRWVG